MSVGPVIELTVKSNRVVSCVGEAINPMSLSLYERMTGVGKNYNKQLDREDLYDDQFQQAQAAGKTAQV